MWMKFWKCASLKRLEVHLPKQQSSSILFPGGVHLVNHCLNTALPRGEGEADALSPVTLFAVPPTLLVAVQSLSRVRLFATPWTVALQAPLSMGFPRKNTGAGCHSLLRRPTPAFHRNSNESELISCSAVSGSLGPYDCCLPGSTVHDILQARIPERIAMPFSRRSSQPRDLTPVSYVSPTGRQIAYH